METSKSAHTVVLDTGSIIKNEPSISTLLSQAESLVTSPSILPEIKDSATRSRVESTLKPFLTTRSPNPSSIKFVMDFARRTGDLAVLSKPDIQIIALAYEIECERNGGDWRLRKTPGQKRVNGAPPIKDAGDSRTLVPTTKSTNANTSSDVEHKDDLSSDMSHTLSEDRNAEDQDATEDELRSHASEQQIDTIDDVTDSMAKSRLDSSINQQADDNPDSKVDSVQNSAESQDESDSDGWITPSNLKRKQAQNTSSTSTPADEPTTMQVAVLTTDFAMQNVILQMNLNLLSPTMTRIKHLKTFVLRCHACFQVAKDLNKQFCPRCGQPSLTRVSCSTNSNGEFKLHLKKNFQWNHRGDKYSIPKPAHGSSNGRVKGGGKGGWGNDLILTEDQKEYQKAAKDEKRVKEKSLMDKDYLPSILTGDRDRGNGRVKIGAGKNVNSKKRR